MAPLTQHSPRTTFPRRAGRRRRRCIALLASALAAAPCAAQPERDGDPPQRPAAAAPDTPPPPSPPPPPPPTPPQPPPPFSIALRAGHTFDANIDGGGSVSTSVAALRFGIRRPVSEQLFLGFSIGAGVRHDEFDGDSGLAPGATEAPWDTAIEYSLGASATYRATRQLTVFGAVNGSSNGEEGADFEDTLTGGISAGFAYAFSPDLTLGLAATAQTRLEDDPLIIPFPTIDWKLPIDPQRRWRLQAGRIPGGPPTAAGAALVYVPSQQLSLFAGIGAAGLGGDFRLDDEGPAPGGVARGRSFPLIAGVDWRPSGALHLSAFAGMTAFGEIELLDADGARLGRRGVDPAPTVGVSVTWQF